MSPSHTVGLEHTEAKTGKPFTGKSSPSHTVGLELNLLWVYKQVQRLSPSHTVGLELNLLWVYKQVQRLSPSHTVGLEPQTTTLIKIRHINHFVKVAPFSNEVNFPKSEVMQSLVCCYQI